jgi:peptide/nickel transport system substrate-binding protein
MKRFLALALALASNIAVAAPFVYPAKWYSSPPQEAKVGGTFRDTTFQDFTGMNPFYVRLDQSIPNRVGSGSFLRLDPVTRDYIPYMAESYTLSGDKRTYTYKLRDGMKWSDGKPITADDWIISYKINTDAAMETEYYDGFFIDGKPIVMTKVDALTIRVTLPMALSSHSLLHNQHMSSPQLMQKARLHCNPCGHSAKNLRTLSLVARGW